MTGSHNATVLQTVKLIVVYFQRSFPRSWVSLNHVQKEIKYMAEHKKKAGSKHAMKLLLTEQISAVQLLQKLW